jgi:hypothetical protein
MERLRSVLSGNDILARRDVVGEFHDIEKGIRKLADMKDLNKAGVASRDRFKGFDCIQFPARRAPVTRGPRHNFQGSVCAGEASTGQPHASITSAGYGRDNLVICKAGRCGSVLSARLRIICPAAQKFPFFVKWGGGYFGVGVGGSDRVRIGTRARDLGFAVFALTFALGVLLGLIVVFFPRAFLAIGWGWSVLFGFSAKVLEDFLANDPLVPSAHDAVRFVAEINPVRKQRDQCAHCFSNSSVNCLVRAAISLLIL